MRSYSISENCDQIIFAKWEKAVLRLDQLLQVQKQINEGILKQSKLVDKLRNKANKKMCEITCA